MKVVRKAVVMAVAHAERDADVADVVDAEAEAVAQTARLERNANASMPKVNPCSQMPPCRAQTLVHQSPPDRNNARTVVRARNAVSVQSVETAQAGVANETKVVNAVSRARKAVQTVYRQPTATPRAAATTAKAVNPAKVAVVAVAMAVVHARTVKHATQTVRAARLNRDW